MSLSPRDYIFIRDLLLDYAGVNLGNEKHALVASRLTSFVINNKLESIDKLCDDLRKRPRWELQERVIEAVLINETSFFRDAHPFFTIRDHILPDLIEKRRSSASLSIWSAACSSGQEPYSLAMILDNNFPETRAWRLSLTASDISKDMIDRCHRGRYRQLEVNRGLPASLLVKYFRRDGLLWAISPEIKNMVDFRRLNLIEPWPGLGLQDIILIRNVLIYFDLPTRKKVLARARQYLKPDGYLFLGAAETTLNIDDAFEQVRFGRTVCYRLRGR